MTWLDLVAARSDAIKKDWQAFLAAPRSMVIAEVIERKAAKLGNRYVEWSPGIVIASDYLLRVAQQNSRQPLDWHRSSQHDGFETTSGSLVVRKRGEFWAIEQHDRVLVFIYGSMPVCTRTPEAAIKLAEYCYPMPRNAPSGLRWIGRSRWALAF